MTLRLSVSTLSLVAALSGSAAMADVAAGDVWSNYQAYVTATGGDLSGDMQTSGAVTTISNAKVNFVFPMGFGNIALAVPDMTLTENGDGTVAVTYPSPMTVAVSGNIQEFGAFSATIESTLADYSVVASGDAGDVTYTGTAGEMSYSLTDIAFDGSEDWEIEASGTIASWAIESRVTEGNLITATSTQAMGENTYTFVAEGPDGLRSTNTGSYGTTEANTVLTLPVGGSEILNLSQAIRDGLTFAITSRGTGSDGQAVTAMDGKIISDQTTSAGPSEVTIAVNETGLSAVGFVDGIDMTVIMDELLPFPIEAALEQLTMNYALPINASDAQQEFRYAFGINGLTLNEQIWGLFDPTGELPRDPATIALDLSGYGVTGLNLLDIPAMMSLTPNSEIPVQVDEVTLNSLTVAAAGAEILAEGSFTLDNSDFETIPGMPRPEGAVDVSLSGVNGLIDKLAAMGFIPEEELMMPRMMLGMFATPVGEDELTSRIEVNGEGHVLANGQRLR